MKLCYCCKQEKSRTEFNRMKSASSGLQGYCKSCAKFKRDKYYQQNRRRENAECRKYYAEHRDKRRQQMAEYKEHNFVAIRAYNAKYQKANLYKFRAYGSARRAARLKRTPPWADPGAIQKFYENCPAGYHVDHIIPLQGRIVSGLHVLENLQYLPASVNIRKKNKLPDNLTLWPSCSLENRNG